MAIKFSNIGNSIKTAITQGVQDAIGEAVRGSPLVDIANKANALSNLLGGGGSLLGSVSELARTLGASNAGLDSIDDLLERLTGNRINTNSAGSGASFYVDGPTEETASYRSTHGTSALPNPLEEYASYNYIFTLAALTPDEVNDPASTIRQRGPTNIILKSAGGAGSKKVKTAYEQDGQLEYFIDDVEIESLISTTGRTGTTTAVSINFNVLEPYSMGMFLQTVQLAAVKSRYPNYLEAPYLLMVEFIGYDDDGNVVSIPNTTRYIPIMFLNVEFEVDGGGSKYTVTAAPYTEIALTDEVQSIKTETAITGQTVAEMLNNGRSSLTTIVNRRLEEQRQSGEVAQNDYYIINFPNDLQENQRAIRDRVSGILKNQRPLIELRRSEQGDEVEELPEGYEGVIQNDSGLSGASANSIATALETLAISSPNEIGQARIIGNPYAQGDHPFGSALYAFEAGTENGESTQIFKRNGQAGVELTISRTNRVFRFPQGHKIQKIIDEVILSSEYGRKLATPVVDEIGMVNWFKIEVQVFSVPNYTQTAQTGTSPKVYVYSVIPYKISADRIALPTQAVPNMQNRRRAVNKVYEYIYTGKNKDILNFDIQFKTAFYSSVLADRGQTNQTARTSTSGAAIQQDQPAFGQAQPASPAASTGEAQRSLREAVSNYLTNTGGGGFQEVETAVARQYHEALINSQADMLITTLEIWGDPYYLADSGIGNYNARDGRNINITADGTIAYQKSEVDVIVGFRTPIDYRKNGHLMEFPEETIPVKAFSGLYQVITITNKFSGGQFKQELELVRRNNQELQDAAQAGGGSIGGIVQNAINRYLDRGQPRTGIREGAVGNTDPQARSLLGSEQAYLIRLLNDPLSVLSEELRAEYEAGNITDEIRNALSEGSALISASLDEIQNLASEGIGEAVDLIGDLGGDLAGAAGQLGDLVVSGLGNIGETLGFNLGNLSFDTGTFSSDFGGALRDVSGALRTGIGVLNDLNTGNIAGALSTIDSLAPPGVDGGLTIPTTMSDFASDLGSGISNFSSGVGLSITGAVNEAVGFASDLLGAENSAAASFGLDTIGGSVSGLLSDAGNLLSSAGEFAGQAIPFGFDPASGLFDESANVASYLDLTLPNINSGVSTPLVNSFTAAHAATLGGIQGDLLTGALDNLTALSTIGPGSLSEAAASLDLASSVGGSAVLTEYGGRLVTEYGDVVSSGLDNTIDLLEPPRIG